jgi:hypothetical protein
MWHIRRIRLVSVGTTAARFRDVTIDLTSQRSGEILDTILWLRNGGGKSSIIALLGAQLRPGRTEFLTASETSSEGARHLEDYVIGADTAHVLVEWGDRAGNRLVTGAVYEWKDRQQPIDPNASWDRLAARWWTFVPDGAQAEIDRLPFSVAGHPKRMDAFAADIKALPLATQAVVTPDAPKWRATLDDRGLDPELWRPILEMNRTEGGIEQKFLYRNADDFAKELLELIVDPSIPGRVAKILTDVARRLAEREDVAADLRFCVEAIGKLTELDEAWRARRDARELLGAAVADSRRLAAQLEAAASVAREDVDRHEGTRSTEDKRRRDEEGAGDVARHTANEYARLAAVFRVTAAEEVERSTNDQITDAKALVAAWSIAGKLAERGRLAARLEASNRAHAAETDDAEPVRAARIAAGRDYAAALEALAADARLGAADAERKAKRATDDAKRAQGDLSDAIRNHASLENRGAELRRASDALERDVDDARRDGILARGELPAAAAERLASEEQAADARQAELTDEVARIADTLGTERTRIEIDRLELEHARRAHDDPAAVLAGLAAERDGLAGSERLLLIAQGADVDPVGMGRRLADELASAAVRADQDLAAAAVAGAEDERDLQGLEADRLLPAALDLVAAARTIDAAGIAATTGWRYLAEFGGGTERAAVFRAAPELVAGILVDDPAELPAARTALETAGVRATTPVALGTTAELQDRIDAASRPGRFIVPARDALFDPDAAESERVDLEIGADARAAETGAIRAARDADAELRRRLEAFLAACPPGHLEALTIQVRELAGARDAVAARLAEVSRNVAALEKREKAVQNELGELGKKRVTLARLRTLADTLAAKAATADANRAEADPIPSKLAALDGRIAAANTAITVAGGVISSQAARRERLSGEAGRHEAARHVLPDEIGTVTPARPTGTSLDAVGEAWKAADEAWRRAVPESALAIEIRSLEERVGDLAREIGRAPAAARDEAADLLGTTDGASEETRAAALERAGRERDHLNVELGGAKAELVAAKDELAARGRDDRERHRVVRPPVDRTEALALADAHRAEMTRHTETAAAAGRAAHTAEGLRDEAYGDAEAFSSVAESIVVPTEFLAVAEAGPVVAWAATRDEARVRSTAVRAEMETRRASASAAEHALASVGTAIVAWAGGPAFARVKAEVASRFGDAGVVDDLGPRAATFRDETIAVRRMQLEDHLAALERERENVVNMPWASPGARCATLPPSPGSRSCPTAWATGRASAS